VTAFRVAHSTAEWASLVGSEKRAVVSVGNFDGLHLGHQEILQRIVERARRDKSIAAAITFDPHPMKVLRPESAPALIMTLAQRLKGFERVGLDAALVLHFDEALARVSAEDFVRTVLVETVHARAIMTGANFRYGYKNAGDVALLKKLGVQYSIAVEIVPPAEVDGKLVSSSAIRQAVAEGRPEEAAALLGRPFTLTGTVQKGAGRGSKILFPTLNLAPAQELLPARGVYATETVIGGGMYRSVTNAGVRPTFDGQSLSIESHLLHFPNDKTFPKDETLSADKTLVADRTGETMEVRFWKRLREERKFPDADALRAQIALDIEAAKAFFAHQGQPTS